MLVELGKILDIINLYGGTKIEDIPFCDTVGWDDMIETIRKLDPDYEKPIDNKPHLFGDEHCLETFALIDGKRIKI